MNTTYKVKKATFKHIESELYAYKDTLKEISKLRQEIMAGQPREVDENVGSNRSPEPGRPTEKIVTRLLTHKTLRNLEEIIEAIDAVYNAMSEDHKLVIRTKYWSGKHLTWEDVALQANMHRNTAMKLRRDVIYMVADKIGWR